MSVQSSGSSISSSEKVHKATLNVFGSLLPRLRGLFFEDQGLLASACCLGHPRAQTPSSILVLDLRGTADFKARHLPGSHSAPVTGLTPELAGGDLFGDASAVHLIWTQVQKTLAQKRVSKLLENARASPQAVVLVCYHGDAARLGCSTLRSQNIEAFSVEGGFDPLWSRLEGLELV